MIRRPFTRLRLDQLERRDTPATFLVTSLDDNAFTSGSFGTFRDALDQANATPGRDDIVFQIGLTGTIQAAAEFTISDEVDITGPGGDQIAVNGFGGEGFTPALLTNTSPGSTVSGLTFQNHRSTAFTGVPGGAIANTGDLTLDGVILRNNSADEGGGVGNTGTLRILNSEISGNTSVRGGGVYSSSGSLTVVDSEITNNYAAYASEGSAVGGGVFVGGGTATFTRTLIAGNRADTGGGISTTDGTTTVIDSIVTGNAAVGSGFGPFATPGYGGGLYFRGNAEVTISGTTFADNTADFGGGIGLQFNSAASSLSVTNVTLTENRAYQTGGGLFVGNGVSPSSVIQLTNVTAVRNIGGGAGIEVVPDSQSGMSADVRLTNTIVARNIVDTDEMGMPMPPQPALDISGEFTSFGGNLIENDSAAIFTPQPSDLTGVDPLVGPLGDNGGPTPTIPLLPGSPALGLGINGPGVPTVDQRGAPRSGLIDAGAYQFQPPIGTADAYATPFGEPLTVPAPGVLGNDVAPDGGPITAVLETDVPSTAGTLVFNPDGSFTFTPDTGISGEVTFTYVPSINGRLGNSTTVTITVLPEVIVQPVGVPDAYTTLFNTPLVVPTPGVVGNDVSPNGRPIAAVLETDVPAAAGTLVLNLDGSFVFTPAVGFSGDVTFTYRPTVAGQAGNPTTVTITVQPPIPPLPPPPPPIFPPARFFAVGAGAGGAPRVRTFDFGGNPGLDFMAFEPSFSGGVRVAVGDVTGDGVADIVAAAGPGGGPRVRVFDGVSGEVIRDFFAFEPNFFGGVYVAAADVNGDGAADVVVGAGSLGGPRVRVYDGRGGDLIRDFFAYDPNFRGGVRVAAGDLDGDGFAEIVTAAGPSGGPHVRTFDGATSELTTSSSPIDPAYIGGLYVAVFPGSVTTPGSIAVGLDSVPGVLRVDIRGPVADARRDGRGDHRWRHGHGPESLARVWSASSRWTRPSRTASASRWRRTRSRSSRTVSGWPPGPRPTAAVGG